MDWLTRRLQYRRFPAFLPCFGQVVLLATISGLAGCAATDGTVQVVQAPCFAPPARVLTAIGYRLLYLRLQEENAIIGGTGSPRPLPTGSCTVVVPVDAIGQIDGPPVINCDNAALLPDLRKAVFAAAPFVVAQAGRIGVRIAVLDAEPGEDNQ